MDDRPPFHTSIQEILDYAIVDLKYVYVDLWSFVHLLSGLLLGMVLARWIRPVIALAWAIGVILAYEVAELALNDILFVPETPVDTIWDVIVGFAGAFVALRITTARARRKAKPDETIYL